MLQVLLLITLGICSVWVLNRTRLQKLPPGPPTNLILGNALQLPKVRPWIRLYEWKLNYGDVISMRILNRQFIVLQSYQAMVDLFERRSDIYAHRPVRTMARLSGFGKALLFQNNGDDVRRARKLMYEECSKQKALGHHSMQQDEARYLIWRLFSRPNDLLVDHLRVVATSSLLNITYGHPVRDPSDPLITLAEEVMSGLRNVITPNKYLVDALPILRHIPEWFPGAGFQIVARQSRETLDKFMDTPYHEVESKMSRDEAEPSFLQRHLEIMPKDATAKDVEVLKWTAGGMYAAGSDTTVSVLSTFVLAMLLHPNVQAKAQAELDEVVGIENLPTFAEQPQLPYITAILQEVLRWQPAAPLVSRSSFCEDEYQGFRIPSRAVIMANTWAIAQDPNIYPDPEGFKPERFLNSSNKEPALDPRLYSFGFGRRSCPGAHVAENFLYIVISTILAAFNILPHNEEGIMPSFEYTTGAVSHPTPFSVRFAPRSVAHEALIRATQDH